MKRKFILIFAVAAALIALSGCYHSVGEIDGLELYTNKSKKDAFVGVYFWDGDENNTTIVIPDEYEGCIPDEYEGCAVTAFGGAFDIGVPVCFDVIYRTESLISENVSLQSVIQNENGEYTGLNIENVDFNLSIGAKINDIDGVDVKRVMAVYVVKDPSAVYYREDDFIALYLPRFYITCSDENETFFSQDGKLYYKSSRELVDMFYYTDFEIDYD